MKRSIFLPLTIIVGLLIIAACSKLKNSKNPEVTIQGGGFSADYHTVYLKYFDHNSLTYGVLDSQSLASNDNFEFKFPFESSNLYELNFDEKEMIPISVENTKTISINKISDEIKVKGSEQTKKMILFRAQSDQLQDKYFGQLKIDFDQAMAENDQDKIEELTQKSEVLIGDFLREFRALIIDLGTTPAAYFALQFSDFNKEIDFIQERLATFKKDAPNSLVTKALEKQVYQATITAIGNTPPSFEGKNAKGQKVNLSEYQGKILLVDFWASWCRACRVENPKLARLYEKYHKNDFEIVSISQDESSEQWLKSIEKDGIGAWEQIHDGEKAISNLYSVSSLPQNILLDKSGVIVAKNINAEELQTILLNM
jgi:thiol-disulfide isomerase/thioredoxin